jgi:hypothetical protein
MTGYNRTSFCELSARNRTNYRFLTAYNPTFWSENSLLSEMPAYNRTDFGKRRFQPIKFPPMYGSKRANFSAMSGSRRTKK